MKADGFSLIEVLVATAILMVAVTTLGQLLVLSANANRMAQATSTATLLAAAKMEELRGQSTVGLSPADSLWQNVAGWVDYAGASGEPVPEAAAAFYVRRWASNPTAGNPGRAVVLQVRVIPLKTAWGPGRAGGVHRAPGEARMFGVRRSGTT